jgi:hypothetical protein
MKLVDTILGFVTLGTDKKEFDTDFDINLYHTPVKNSRRNILIENVQWCMFSINIFSWIMLLFIDLGAVELVLMNVIPIAIIMVIGMFKDREAQEAYDKYAEWKEQRDEYIEILEEEDLYDQF